MLWTGVKQVRDYQLLYNPGNAAQIDWRPWPRGSWDTNFPLGVFKSDSGWCGLMVGRYNDGDETALINKDGLVFYQQGLGSAWYWDNNEYDLLVERAATGVEILELNYGEVTYNVSERYEVPNGFDDKFSVSHDNCDSTETSSKVKHTFEMDLTGGSRWWHSVQFGVSFGAEIQISAPSNGLIDDKYGLETSYSYEHGWGSSKSREESASFTLGMEVEPGGRLNRKVLGFSFGLKN